MRGLADFVTGKRRWWISLAVAIGSVLIAFMLAPFGTKVSNDVDDTFESFLPDDAQSTEVAKTLRERFASGQTTGGLIVYYRPGGLTEEDKRKVLADAQRATRELEMKAPPVPPFQPSSPP